MAIELLEPRIAPASVLTFTDVDGDVVQIISSHGNLAGKATFANVGLGQQLQLLDLTRPAFAGADIKTVVTRGPTGDGQVNIGQIDASGIDLGHVTVGGDLASLFCGDGDPKNGPGLKSLDVLSMGVFGAATQMGKLFSLETIVDGSIGTVHVRGDMRGTTIGALGVANAKDGYIGSIYVGGSLIGGGLTEGAIFSSGDIGTINLRGDLIGGPSLASGTISCNGTLHSLVIGGSVIGGQNDFSADISAGDFGTIKIGGDLRGGTDGASGMVRSQGKIGSLTIGGSLIGGRGDARYTDGVHQFTGQVVAFGDVGSITIAHDVIGGSGTGSGSVQTFAKVGSIRVGGSVIGGEGDESGKIDVAGSLTSLRIGGSLTGGAGAQQTYIGAGGFVHEGQVFVGSDLGSLRVGGDVLGKYGAASGEIRSGGNMGAVSIGGSLMGGFGASGGQLASQGNLGAVKIGGDVAGGTASFSGYVVAAGNLASVTIGGSVLGSDADHTGEITADGTIGAVKINGNLQGGSITLGEASLESSGFVHGGRISSVFIGGSIITGTDGSRDGSLDHNASIRALHDLGAVKVRGNLSGNIASGGATSVIISAVGQATLHAGATTDLAIKSVSVGGRVAYAKILGGFAPDDLDNTGTNGHASIGAVKVGGSWTASSVSAGIQDRGDLGFGTDGDKVIPGAAAVSANTIIARIASITIKGAVTGGADLPFHSGFVAQQIGSFKSNGFTARLTAGTDGPIPFLDAPTNETIREY